MFAAYHHIQLWIRNANMECVLLHCVRPHRTISIQHTHTDASYIVASNGRFFGKWILDSSKSILFYGSRVFAITSKIIHSLCVWFSTLVFNFPKRWLYHSHHQNVACCCPNQTYKTTFLNTRNKIKYSNESFQTKYKY